MSIVSGREARIGTRPAARLDPSSRRRRDGNWSATPEAAREGNGRDAKAALFDEFARLAQALANGRRLEIVDLLANGERTVEGVGSSTGLSVANASQHLQVLRGVGLVRRRRDGNRIYYALRDSEVFELWRNLRSVAAQHRAEVARSEEHTSELQSPM